MHERTERAVARLLFVFLCALPTAITSSVVLVSVTPWYADHRRRAIQHELATRLGVRVEIERVEHPSPQATRLVGLRMLHPETGGEVGRVRLVTWTRGDTKRAVRLSQPEVNSEHLDQLWRVLHDRFLCQPELTDRAFRLAADDLTIHSTSGAVTLRDVDAWLRPLEERVEATIQCVPAGRRDDAPVHITVARDRSRALANTQWTLNSGDLPLACSALADHFPAIRRLGPDATFAGNLRWRLSPQGWMLDLGGSRFEGIDANGLLHHVPHRLTGTAAVTFERCLLDPGSGVDVSGTLVLSDGFIGGSLLQSAAGELGLELHADQLGQQDTAYERIAMRFDLFGPRLSIAGVCHQLAGYEYLEPSSVVVAEGRSVASSRGQPQSWASLVRTLWQDGRQTLPASPQSAWLMQLLPSPRLSTAGEPLPPRITGTGEYRGGVTVSQP